MSLQFLDSSSRRSHRRGCATRHTAKAVQSECKIEGGALDHATGSISFMDTEIPGRLATHEGCIQLPDQKSGRGHAAECNATSHGVDCWF